FDTFEGHDFFPVNLKYRVQATLTVTEGTPFFGMKTTTSRFSTERIYGHVTFSIEGREFRLPVYQSKDLMSTEEYADYLFFPFTDLTNGQATYGGGRYIDLRIPKGGSDMIIDFNKAYNPYCAYSPRYSCPLVPAENQMDIEIPAGVKYDATMKSTTTLLSANPDVVLKPDVMPQYPGGLEAMTKFVGKHMTYPKEALKEKTQGTVYVAFIVKADGAVSEIKTIKGISAACDAEAERVVSLMPNWTPGQLDGKNVAVQFVLPINFKGRPGWK
ncbi:MAG TPA: TonB family protein, partial [Ohtaekwangia sp.]